MELYVRVKVTSNSTYKVKPGMFPEVSTDEIFARALLQAKDDIVAENMVQMIAGMMGNNATETSMPGYESIVVTNRTKVYGAVAIYDKEMLSKIAEKYDSNLVILPSSIHECIICVDNDPDLNVYSDMVRSVNQIEVRPEERLSDHAYLFDKVSREITW